MPELILPKRPELILPTYWHAPDYVETLGPEVGDLCRMAKFGPDPEQQLVLDAQFGLTKQGKLAAFEVAVIAPRQNIKTGVKKQAALGKVFLLKRPLYVWTAHEMSTTQESFRDLCILIESTPEFDRRVQNIRTENGAEAIELDGGQRIIFRARTKTGGRGLSGDDVGYDEAFALRPHHVGATMPLLSTRENPQIGYYSSAEHPGSTVLRKVRIRGRAKRGQRLVYAEWCYPGEPGEFCAAGDECDHDQDTEGCSLDNLELLQQANTQMGQRITVVYILDERASMDPAEFGRERAGWPDKPGTEDSSPAIDVEVFKGLLNPEAKQPNRAILSIAVSPSRKAATVGVAGEGEDGKVLLFVKHFTGTAGVVPLVKKLVKKRDIVEVLMNPTGGGAALLPALKKAGIEYSKVSGVEQGQACGWLQTAVDAGEIEHGGQADLITAIENATTRTSGESQQWDQRDPAVDITAANAVAMAGFRWSQENDYDVEDSFL